MCLSECVPKPQALTRCKDCSKAGENGINVS